MARVRTRMPNVFVGHPFARRFAVKKFRAIFRGLPFNVIYGNTDLQTRQLLSIMKSNITKADYSIFDLSNWNPNVALELGLAEGLRARDRPRNPAKRLRRPHEPCARIFGTHARHAARSLRDGDRIRNLGRGT